MNKKPFPVGALLSLALPGGLPSLGIRARRVSDRDKAQLPARFVKDKMSKADEKRARKAQKREEEARRSAQGRVIAALGEAAKATPEEIDAIEAEWK